MWTPELIVLVIPPDVMLWVSEAALHSAPWRIHDISIIDGIRVKLHIADRTGQEVRHGLEHPVAFQNKTLRLPVVYQQ